MREAKRHFGFGSYAGVKKSHVKPYTRSKSAERKTGLR